MHPCTKNISPNSVYDMLEKKNTASKKVYLRYVRKKAPQKISMYLLLN